jgi:hypothetical protein
MRLTVGEVSSALVISVTQMALIMASTTCANGLEAT